MTIHDKARAVLDACRHAGVMGVIAESCTGGLIAGAIPGFTITMAVVLTLPFTFGMPPVQGLSTMLAVFVGGLAGGLIARTSVGSDRRPYNRLWRTSMSGSKP